MKDGWYIRNKIFKSGITNTYVSAARHSVYEYELYQYHKPLAVLKWVKLVHKHPTEYQLMF